MEWQTGNRIAQKKNPRIFRLDQSTLNISKAFILIFDNFNLPSEFMNLNLISVADYVFLEYIYLYFSLVFFYSCTCICTVDEIHVDRISARDDILFGATSIPFGTPSALFIRSFRAALCGFVICAYFTSCEFEIRNSLASRYRKNYDNRRKQLKEKETLFRVLFCKESKQIASH